MNSEQNTEVTESDQFDENQINQPFAMKLFILISKKKMASCFDFRLRTTSFDLHQLTQRHKISKLGKLFRSQSEGSVRSTSPKGSPKQSPKQSPRESPTGVVRRRFIRVVRNEESPAEEYENPHVIRRYTQEYLQEQWAAQQSSESFDDENLPYMVSGHTILKKHTSGERTESPTGDQSPMTKHTSFKEEVEVFEFNKKDKIKTCSICTHTERLQDSDEEQSSDICDSCLKKGKEECPHNSSESEVSDCDMIVNTSEQKRTRKISKEVFFEGEDEIQTFKTKECEVESIVNKLDNLDLSTNERSRSMPSALMAES